MLKKKKKKKRKEKKRKRKRKEKVYWLDKENLMNPSEVNFKALRQVNQGFFFFFWNKIDKIKREYEKKVRIQDLQY